MSNHVTEWLNAYMDGELQGRQFRQVEAHLAECEACRMELESLQGLSALLHEVNAPEFASNERFVTQVNLLLPERRNTTTGNKIFEVGWWMIPVGLLAAWIFISTASLVSDMIFAADSFGVLDSQSALWVSDSSDSAILTSRLGQVGMLQGEGLQWAETTESFTRNILPQFIWQAAIAFLYLSWIAIWWARQMFHGQVPLIEN